MGKHLSSPNSPNTNTMLKITSIDEWNALKESDKTVFVDFTATWCGPCRFIGPYFEELAEQNPEAEFVSVDVDEMKDISEECGIRAMPTFKAYKKGSQIGELVGASKDKLKDLVMTHKAG